MAQRLESQVLGPLVAGQHGRYQAWDWQLGRWGGHQDVPWSDVLIVEGCGAGDRLLQAYTSLLVWVEAPPELRLERGIERDGEPMRAEWERWRVSESRHFFGEETRSRAQLLVDGAAQAPDPETYAVVLAG